MATYLDGVRQIGGVVSGDLPIGGDLTVTGNATFSGTVTMGTVASAVDTDYPLVEKKEPNGDIIASITTKASSLTDAAQQSEVNIWGKQAGVLKKLSTEGSISLADDAEITLDASRAGLGHVMIGDLQEHAYFGFTTVPAVTLITNSANVKITDSDGDFCIYPSGSNVKIKNRLDGTLILRYSIKYSTV